MTIRFKGEGWCRLGSLGTADFGSSRLVGGQPLRMGDVVLVQVQPTCINSRPEQKKKKGVKCRSVSTRQNVKTLRSPCRFDLAPEAQRFVNVEFALSRQSREDVLLQPDDLRSVPAVGRLLSGDRRECDSRTQTTSRFRKAAD